MVRVEDARVMHASAFRNARVVRRGLEQEVT
jgi:hypothetical protein